MQQTMRWSSLIIMMLVLFGIFFFFQNKISAKTLDLEEQETTLRVNLSSILDKNLSLQDEIANVGSEYYIESKARAEYQFVKPGELSFSFTNPAALYEYSEEEIAILQQEAIQ